MKTVCTLLVPGVDIPGTMYRAITATTSLALRVIFMKTIKEPAGIHAYTLNDVALLTDIFPKLLVVLSLSDQNWEENINFVF